MVPSSSCSSSSTNPSLKLKIPSTRGGKLTINIKSPTSEMYTEVKEADKVKDLEKLIKKSWGDNDDNDYHMILYHKSIILKSDHFLSSYNLRDGSVIRVSILAEPPHPLDQWLWYDLGLNFVIGNLHVKPRKMPNFNMKQAAAAATPMVKMVVAT
ncbi:putative TSL-kinase interacting protein 1-like isoform X1 [Capsicum annuum]|nr:putative TSL-kinase interacting protein 1-like isoform X1 [Capsicum annuum]